MIKISIIGNLGSDAEVRDAAGKKVISFNVAHSEKYTDRNGVRQETTTWVRCSYWRDEGRTGVAQYLTKGKTVYVEGIPTVQTYQNREGQMVASLECRVTDLQLVGGGRDGASGPPMGGGGGGYSQPSQQQPPMAPPPAAPYGGPQDDDLPF